MASDYPERDIFDELNETAGKISDADVEDRLRQVFSRAGYSYQGPDPYPAEHPGVGIRKGACPDAAGSHDDEFAGLRAALAGPGG